MESIEEEDENYQGGYQNTEKKQGYGAVHPPNIQDASANNTGESSYISVTPTPPRSET